MVMRIDPKKNNTTWIYVKPDRALGAGDVRDRAKLSSRRQQGGDHEAFPARTAAEKSEVLEKVQEKQFEADWYLSNLSGYVAYLSWLRSGLVRLWSR